MLVTLPALVLPSSRITLMPLADEKESRSSHPHPYLHGNFALIHRVVPLTPCSYTGSIPEELAGGEYVRNGGNPVTNEDLDRDAQWFDGDGMLSGDTFRRAENGRKTA
jgi:carotenoid cleavage dioxygenase-like enzyme